MDHHKAMLKLFPKIIFTLLLFFLAACNQYYTEQYIQIKEDGLIYKAGMDDPFTGRVIDTLNHRILEYEVVNGRKNGEFKVSMLNGVVTVDGRVQNNKNIGVWNYYYANGKLESSGHFENDRPAGKWLWYYSDGSLKQSGSFINGKKVGEWHLYDKDGKLVSLMMFEDGELVNEVKINTGKNL